MGEVPFERGVIGETRGEERGSHEGVGEHGRGMVGSGRGGVGGVRIEHVNAGRASGVSEEAGVYD
jgi:hypothetical protein